MDTLLRAVLEGESPPHLPHEDRLPEVKPHTFYLYEEYDWDAFLPDYSVIRLSKGYFTIVDHEDLERAVTLKALRAREEICPETGRILKVRALGQTGDKKYYLHRFLTDAGEDEVIDHFNRHPLDNRRKRNLVKTNQGANLANTGRQGKNGLLCGVEPWGKKYGGVINYKGKRFRSPDKWSTQEPAHAWYLAKHKELYGYTDSQGAPLDRSYPVFPPKKGEVDGLPF